ncbi:OmpH family outer membrane protein [Epibacterium sp. MM17-32]|uniref:OmpH family outer membrane protein n=1 Tax=Epibacterium sp. MM17-32 TaxID=2917734 RepID=UPI001EF737AE|nr:OmpH family outer membrane protein [Epibacterium sp. MM17-32]MCG7626380.1 OmpH family outer membrane protein [Epibacterium sp. MM17-32]
MAWLSCGGLALAQGAGSTVGLGGFSPEQNLGVPSSLLLTIHSDRLFSESAYGKRVAQEMEGRSAVLMAENRRIEAELRAEELDLAERRSTTDPEAFRALAEAFDQKVQETRRTQEAKFLEITNAREEARREFRQTSIPILERIMTETGAAAILEQSTVLLSAEAIDVTDLAIARVDAILGDGAEADVAPADEP